MDIKLEELVSEGEIESFYKLYEKRSLVNFGISELAHFKDLLFLKNLLADIQVQSCEPRLYELQVIFLGESVDLYLPSFILPLPLKLLRRVVLRSGLPLGHLMDSQLLTI